MSCDVGQYQLGLCILVRFLGRGLGLVECLLVGTLRLRTGPFVGGGVGGGGRSGGHSEWLCSYLGMNFRKVNNRQFSQYYSGSLLSISGEL